MSTTTAVPPNPPTTSSPQADASTRRTQNLGRYRVRDTGQEREVLRVQRPNGSALVVDYEFGTLCDGRLIAHLSPDEPAENARIVSDLYLADDERRGRCRTVTPEDFQVTRHVKPSPSSGHAPLDVSRLQDAAGRVYRIREVPLAGAPLADRRRELRWTRSRLPGREDSFDAVTLRDVVGSLEVYEPARSLTRDALSRLRPVRLGRSTARGGAAAHEQRDRAQPGPARSSPPRASSWRAEHERDRAALRARQARRSRQRQWRDELARPPHRPAARRGPGSPLPVDSQ